MNYYIAMSQKQDIFTLMGGRVQINRGRYNPTSDAVWLAAFADAPARTVLDVGVGTGGVALCMMAHRPSIQMTGIDISRDMLDECGRNAALNRRDIELIETDILTWKTNRTFDLVVTNPPYFKGTPAHHNAHHNVDLPAWTRACVKRVRPMGTFCTIVDAAVADEIICALGGRCGDITVFPLFGGRRVAERALIRAKLGARGGMGLYSGASMNFEPVLRDGLTIDAALATLLSKC